MAVRAVSFLLLFASSSILFHQTTSTADPALTPVANDDDDDSLRVEHVESRTSSITVKWTSNFTDQYFQVFARSLTSGILLLARPTNETELTLTDLTVDTSYKVCVLVNTRSSPSAVSLAAGIMSGDHQDHTKVVKACLMLSTIPYIRIDSVLVLFGVVSFIVLSIVAAIFCWKCSLAEENTSASATDEDKEPGNAEEGFETKKSADEEQPLLDSDNNQYPEKNTDLKSEKVDSEADPVVSTQQKSELEADGQPDKPILV